MEFDKLLRVVVEKGASDLFITAASCSLQASRVFRRSSPAMWCSG